MVLIFLLAGAAHVQAQEKAPAFSFHHVDGQSASLSDLRGEVLYLSFWASWCKPCIVNFEKYEQTRDRLQEMGITLLNVNIDQSEEKWKQAMETHHINGIHVRGQDLDSLQSLYQLYSIPSYEIINKRGEFVYLSDGGSRDIFQEFEVWMKE